jgi:hypothetical protein
MNGVFLQETVFYLSCFQTTCNGSFLFLYYFEFFFQFSTFYLLELISYEINSCSFKLGCYCLDNYK